MNWKNEVEQFRKAMKVEDPSMSSSFLRIGFFGLTGGGKSVTSGIFALGLTGPTGIIGWIDGEGRRSGYAIDEVADLASKFYSKPKQSFIERFKVVHVDPPFNPLVGVAAIETLEDAGCKTIIVDMCSQLWDSEGGYLDMKEEKLNQMAGDNAEKRMKSAAAAAAQVKPWTHGKFVSKVNSAKAHIILIFQAKNKWNPKTNKVDEYVSPIQESGMTRTALVVGRVEANERGAGGYCNFSDPVHGTKFTHKAMFNLLPKPDEQMSFSHGEAVAKWCAAPPVPAVSQPAAPVTTPDIKKLKSKLWHLTVSKHEGDPKRLEQWLWDEAILSDTESISTLTPQRFAEILEKTEAKLNEGVPL